MEIQCAEMRAQARAKVIGTYLTFHKHTPDIHRQDLVQGL